MSFLIITDKIDTILTAYFLEEVIDWSAEHIDPDHLNWYRADHDLADAQSSLPPMLAALKAMQSDPRTFHGRPIIGPPALNVSNKHLGYVYTWYSLGGLLAAGIWLTKRRGGRRLI
jgi:cytochrome oxidase assembly protein ShyY1